MVILGLTMQNRDKTVPQEVAEWLKARREKYPLVEFQVDVMKTEGMAGYRELSEKYQRFYSMQSSGPVKGCGNVVFPYGRESWHVKIMGLVDEEGKIVDASLAEKGKYRSLPAEFRNAIAGIPLENVSETEGGIGEVREADNPLRDAPGEMVEIPWDFRRESEVTMSAMDFGEIMDDSKTRKEATDAFVRKGWEGFGEFVKKRSH